MKIFILIVALLGGGSSQASEIDIFPSQSCTEAKVIHNYCRCTDNFGIHFEHINVMSNGAVNTTLSIKISPNGAYYEDEMYYKCQMMVKQCTYR